MKITVLDGYTLNPGDLCWDDFGKMGDLTVYMHTQKEELLEHAKDSDILITNKVVLDEDIISRLPKLKYIGVIATGYNVVDVEAARKYGVVVTNIPAYSTMSVAQHVFALLLSVTDRVEHYTKQVKEGKWSKCRDFCYWDTPLVEIAGKKFGIVGMGNIGTAVAKIASAFGMNVLAFSSKPSNMLPEEVKKVSLEELYQECDIISLHCPLTDKTRHMINRESLSEMKEGVILINTGRGPLVDEKDVAEALKDGKIGAFCADVLSTEPPSEHNPLISAPNVYITPHIAWATKEARSRLMKIAVDNLKSFLEGHPVNVVS